MKIKAKEVQHGRYQLWIKWSSQDAEHPQHSQDWTLHTGINDPQDIVMAIAGLGPDDSFMITTSAELEVKIKERDM